jgi:23S rRNA (uridine2552-2'-O)-methyltransferase
MARSKSSRQWLQEHFHDEYVKLAQAQGFRSRAVFKLKEIQEKDKLIKPGMNVVDLGAAPGSWSQYTQTLLKNQGRIVALDILPMQELDGVNFIQGDFREDHILQKLMDILDNAPINVIMSDMAPNLSGNKAIDQPQSIYLAELALDTAKSVLMPGGSFLVKVFQGEGFDTYKKDTQDCFAKLLIRKPKASRPRSNEVYLVGKGFK